MALSSVSYVGNGSTDQYAITFGYISQDDVTVKVEGVSVTFTWDNDAQVKLDAVPEQDDIIFIYRSTENEDRLVDFTAASILDEASLDLDSNQLFYVVQEAKDDLSNALQLDQTTDEYDADNKRIKNLDDGVSDDEAVNVGQMAPFVTDCETAQTAAEVAQAAAEAAQVLAETAQTAAELAETNAETAETAAELAETNAETAQTAAETAQTAAELAETNAETAEAGAAADLVLTNADVVLTGLDVISTNADVVTTNADAATTTQDAIDTAADAAATAADLVATNQDTIDTAADLVATNQDTIDTAADVVLTNADVVLTGLDAAATAQDAIDTAADLVATNQDTIDTAADAATTAQDAIDTAADVVLTGIDAAAADADRILAETARTGAETAETNAETAETNAELAEAHAEEWADQLEDTEITFDAGKYSAFHWAQKAEDFAASAPQTDEQNEWTAAQNIDEVAVTSSGNGVIWAGDTKSCAYHNMTENTTIGAPTNANDGSMFTIRIEGDGSSTLAWVAAFKWGERSAPEAPAADGDMIIVSVYHKNGVFYATEFIREEA